MNFYGIFDLIVVDEIFVVSGIDMGGGQSFFLYGFEFCVGFGMDVLYENLYFSIFGCFVMILFEFCVGVEFVLFVGL